MIRRRICYLLLLAAGIFFMMLYNFQGLRFLICCVFFIPLVSWIVLIFQLFFCRIEWEAQMPCVMRGEEAQIGVFVENRSILPLSRVMVELRWKAPGERARRLKRQCPGLSGQDREMLLFSLEAKHCGRAAIELRRMFVYDYLGIFRLPAGRKRKGTIYILPRIEPIPAQVGEAYTRILQESGGEKEGDLLLRDFRPGDSLHRVYWKLLAKGGEMQVRDFEYSNSVTVLLNFRETFRKQADAWDRYLDRACSLLYFFAGERKSNAPLIPEVIWRQGEAFRSCQISDQDAVQAWVFRMIEEDDTGRILPENEVPAPERVWHLEEDGGLYFGEQCVYEE